MTEEERYQKLANERQAALDKSNQAYEDLLNQNNVYSQSVDTYLNNYQTTQNDIYDKQLAYQTELQEQNKQKAEKEFQKEAQASKNAYYDFINPYGVQAEIQSKNGLAGSGYSETAKSQAWTTQQNRTAQARASMNEAKLQFDNAIKEAQLNNDTQKAQLALQILEQKQNEMLRSFNYTSDTKLNQLNNYQNLDSDYNNRYNTLYNQIADERAKAEAIRQYEKNFAEQQRQWEAEQAEKQRQYNESLAYQKEQDRIAKEQWEKEYALSQAKLYGTGGSSGSYSSGSSGKSSGGSGLSGNDNYLSDDYNTTTNTQSNPYLAVAGALAANTSVESGKTVNPYTGTRNSDADKFNTFSNGYQPKGISGYGTVSKTGDTISVNGKTQNIWKTSDGSTWYWDGRSNQYVRISSASKSSGKGGTGATGTGSGGGGSR